MVSSHLQAILPCTVLPGVGLKTLRTLRTPDHACLGHFVRLRGLPISHTRGKKFPTPCFALFRAKPGSMGVCVFVCCHWFPVVWLLVRTMGWKYLYAVQEVR